MVEAEPGKSREERGEGRRIDRSYTFTMQRLRLS